MAGEVQVSGRKGQGTGWFLLWNKSGQVYNGTTFVTYATGDLATYDIALTEKGSLGEYQGDFPAVAAGIYRIVAYYGSVAESANRLGDGVVHWDGTNLISLYNVTLADTGLDNLPITAPTGPATNIREMIVQKWRRWFKKTDLASGSLKTYADNGSTVITTQTITDSGGTQTQGAAT